MRRPKNTAYGRAVHDRRRTAGGRHRQGCVQGLSEATARENERKNKAPRFISCIGVLCFAGLTAYDTQKVKETPNNTTGTTALSVLTTSKTDRIRALNDELRHGRS